MPKQKSKRAILTTLVSRKSGASIALLQKQLGWQPHTIRAEISRLRKSGLVVTCTANAGCSVYKAQQREPVSSEVGRWPT